jgi:hypothetical protein
MAWRGVATRVSSGARAPRRRVDGVEGRGRVDANASRYGRPPSRSRSGFGRGAHAWRRCSWAMSSDISLSTSSRGLSPGWDFIIAAILVLRRPRSTSDSAQSASAVMSMRKMAAMRQQMWCQRSSNNVKSQAMNVSADGGIAARIRTDSDLLPPVPSYAGNRVASRDAKLIFPARGTKQGSIHSS